MSSPDDLMVASVEDLGWTNAPYDDPGSGSVQTAKGTTRAEAKDRYEFTVDHGWTAVQAWKRHARIMTRQEAWEAWGRDQFEWEDAPNVDGDDSGPIVPEQVPDDWDPGYAVERNPCWQFMPPGAPGAIEVWIVGEIENGPPPNVRWRDGEIVDVDFPTPGASRGIDAHERDVPLQPTSTEVHSHPGPGADGDRRLTDQEEAEVAAASYRPDPESGAQSEPAQRQERGR